MERLLAGHYQAVWGFTVRKKSGRSGAKWVNDIFFFFFIPVTCCSGAVLAWCMTWCFVSFPIAIFQIIIKDTKIVLTAPHIKSYMLQTLLGLEYLHAHWILHRVRCTHTWMHHVHAHTLTSHMYACTHSCTHIHTWPMVTHAPSYNTVLHTHIHTWSMVVMMMGWCLMSSDVIWHIRDKLWPMPKHGSIKSTYVRCMRV